MWRLANLLLRLGESVIFKETSHWFKIGCLSDLSQVGRHLTSSARNPPSLCCYGQRRTSWPRACLFSLVVDATINLLGSLTKAYRAQAPAVPKRLEHIVEEVSRLDIKPSHVAFSIETTVCNELAVPFLLNRETSIFISKLLHRLLYSKLVSLCIGRFREPI